ncbi:Putative acetate transporter GPR1/FUN34/SatP family [Septoria linicola]|uniref:Acetate transporter GPR1/FUN34/SatP family n=1 Tax=Septoria linicola TaxID=215465 RepID=A0A9Q9EE22_9PEZI|nr:putative acetate transporter GPR1/FUN34/SatP family [Septoria linicola]USW47415.1 Putative acetate transporter GPR1/FUN34/SatP family [Septoria linicola]
MSQSPSFEKQQETTHEMSRLHHTTTVMSPAKGGEFEPGQHANIAQQKKIANPAPLGLGAFALTTFVLSCINLKVLDVTAPNLVVALAYGYGGLVQLLAGMWEMAVGNTFGATALSSYGGFWISFGILLTPSFGIVQSYVDKTTGASNFSEVFALYLWGWFIFTTLCMLLTTRSTVAFLSLFVVLDLAFLCLALSEQYAATAASAGLQQAGGVFGILAAFLAWWNMFAGMADGSNFWFAVPVVHLPWSDKKKRERADERV